MWISAKTDLSDFELDEVFWFTNIRKGHESGVNAYIMTMISREPRQIVAFDVDTYIKWETIQAMIDRAPHASNYSTDGGFVYRDIYFPGKHIRNCENKNDTHNIESTNADLRHYIAGLRRRSRCFFRKLETLKSVLATFINAFNKFGERKMLYRQQHPNCGRDFNFSHLDYI